MFSPQLMAHIVKVEKEQIPEKVAKVGLCQNKHNDLKYISDIKILFKKYLRILLFD